MLAYDGGIPALSATSLVVIDVNRNLVNPEFVDTEERVSIPETMPAGSIIASVNAQDLDLAVSSPT